MLASLPGPPPLAGLFPLLAIAALTLIVAMVILAILRRVTSLTKRSKAKTHWGNKSVDSIEDE